MEKTKNKYYQAVSILCYVFGALALMFGVLGLLGMDSANAIFQEIYEEYVAEFEGDTELALAYTELVEAVVQAYFIACLIGAGLKFALGVIFGRYVEMDDKTANEKFGRAIALCVAMFVCDGLITGCLSLMGLVTVQKVQKDRFNSKGTETVTTNQSEMQKAQPAQKQEISLEDLEKIRTRLAKLEELKKMNALSDEEYTNLRAEIMAKINLHNNNSPESAKTTVENVQNGAENVKIDTNLHKNQQQADETLEKRLERLEKLKNSGAISEKEYETLKKDLQNEN